MIVAPGLPRAVDANLLSSSPGIVPLVRRNTLVTSVVDAVLSAAAANGATSDGVFGANGLLYNDAAALHVRLSTANNYLDGITGATFGYEGLALWNGGSYDRARNNERAVLLTSATRSSSTVWANQRNYNAKGVVLILRVTATPGGAETLQFQVVAIDVGSGAGSSSFANFTIPANTTGTFTFFLYPGEVAALATSLNNGSLATIIPIVWAGQITHSAAGNWTYSLESHTIN